MKNGADYGFPSDLNGEYEKSIEEFNGLSDKYNEMLREYNQNYITYKTGIKNFNQKTSEYNALAEEAENALIFLPGFGKTLSWKMVEGKVTYFGTIYRKGYSNYKGNPAGKSDDLWTGCTLCRKPKSSKTGSSDSPFNEQEISAALASGGELKRGNWLERGRPVHPKNVPGKRGSKV